MKALARGRVYDDMGKYRHVADLRSFVSSLTFTGQAPLHLVPAADFRQRRGAANRLAGALPELPDPVHADLGAAILPAPKRGRGYVLPWSIALDSVRMAQAQGSAPQPLDGYDGEYMALLVEGAEGVELDDEFKAAVESGDAVWKGRYLFVRVAQAKDERVLN